MPKFVHVINLDAGTNWIEPINRDGQTITELLEYLEPGEEVILKIIEMTEEEYQNLPEFQG